MNEETCRLCLAKRAVVNIFEEVKEVLIKIKRCCPFDIIEEDGLPQCICIECLSTLGICDNFLTKCIESDRYLREQYDVYLTANNIKREPFDTIKYEGSASEDFVSSICRQSNQSLIDNLTKQRNEEIKIDKNSLCDLEIECTKNAYENTFSDDNDKIMEADSQVYYDHNERKKLRKDTRSIKKSKSLKKISNKNIKKKVLGIEVSLEPRIRSFNCTRCGISFENYNIYQKHKRTHTLPVTCDICNKSFCNNATLLRHNHRTHFITPIHYQEKYSRRNNLPQELKASVREICDVCGKAIRRDHIRDHKRTHTEEKNISCDICMKTFKLHSYLRKHCKLTHNDNTVLCDICKKTFSNKGTIKKHMIKVHLSGRYDRRLDESHNEKNKMKLCNICGKTVCRDYIVDHMRIHSEERNFMCEICMRTFKTRGCYNTHMRTHTSGIFMCNICMKTFKSKDYLRKHVRKVHLKKRKSDHDVKQEMMAPVPSSSWDPNGSYANIFQ